MNHSNFNQQKLTVDRETIRATRWIVRDVLSQLESNSVRSPDRLVRVILRLLGEPIDAFAQRTIAERESIVARMSTSLALAQQAAKRGSQMHQADTRCGLAMDTHCMSLR